MDITLERIIQELKTQNKTQTNLTNFLGINYNSFGNWKAGLNHSYRKYLHAIANFLDVSVEYLKGETEVRKPLCNDLPPEKNTIKIAGRDGSFVERKLTDDQLDLIKKMIAQLPDADDL